jgi:ADP-ribose pyrophosphatase YjhB (NUDIX family)
MIRVGAKAVIVKKDKVLLIKYKNGSGVHYNFPGGGIERGESIEDGLAREVLEETGAQVDVKKLLLVGEYEPGQHKRKYGRTHKLTLYFLCKIRKGTKVKSAKKPDSKQVDEVWFPIDKLPKSLLPRYHDLVISAMNGREEHDPFTTRA